ncbi:MAG: efflux RND transporter permease subunit [Myxococcales bacterium]|nr:efflux RND transporter permease subunit [Myxococcales bacterium]
MWISDYAIRKPIVTTVVMIALVVFGLVALSRLDTDEFPDVEVPLVAVTVVYPGASPGTVERELVDPLEESFQSLAGVDNIQSTAVDGYAVIIVFFRFGKDIGAAAQDIRDKISEKRADLPTEMEEPILSRFKASDFPIVSLVLASDTLDPVDLTELAEQRVSRALSAIPGVASVSVVGGTKREMTIAIRPRALAAVGLGIPQVVAAVATQSLAAPVGRLTGPYDERTIRLRGRLETARDFEQLVLTRSGTSVVRLGDVADVAPGAEDARSAALYDGTGAVAIDIKKASGYSTTDVSAKIRAVLAELRDELGTKHPGTRLEVVRDSGVRVEASVDDVKSSLIEGALLTILVVFVFLKSWRSTVITGLALPVSVIASFIAVLAFGFTLNVMSLLGLSLAIGILIDDAIVVRENIVRHMERGKDHVAAAKDGTSEIGLAVAATTFSIVVVFVPIAFMGGVAQQWFAPFALTIACSVLVSLFVSFSLDPMLSAVWPDPEATGHQKTWLTRKLEFFDRGFNALTRFYKRVIRWALRHRLLMVVVMFFVLIGTAAIPGTGMVGCAFMPIQDRSEFTIQIETPPGSNLDYTRGKVAEAVALVRAHPEVAYTYATVGGQGGTVDSASIYVRLVPKGKRSVHQDVIAQRVRNQIRALSGVVAYISTGGFGPAKQIQIELTGEDFAVLTDLAEQVAARVATVPGAVDVGLSSKGQRPEVEVVLDRELAGALGVSVADVAQSLRPAFTGLDVADWIDPAGRTRDVMVRVGADWRQRPEDLEALPLVLNGPTGATTVPLGQIAKVNRSLGPTLIEHKDGDRVITVGANTEGRPLSAVIADIESKLADLSLPPGYERRQGGEAEDQAEVFTRIFIALGAAVMLMYFILVIQFGSFLEPLPIMASLPLSLIGVMLAMLVTGSTLNLMSMIGVIMLMGIVAKNAILLIDFAKQAEREGLSREEALVEAGGVRLRPIIMTSVAIVAGMLPIAIGSGEGGDFRAPLGRAVIGGVITSTVLTLLVIPTYYDILTNGRDRLIRFLRRKRHAPGAPPAPVTPAPVEAAPAPAEPAGP